MGRKFKTTFAAFVIIALTVACLGNNTDVKADTIDELIPSISGGPRAEDEYEITFMNAKDNTIIQNSNVSLYKGTTSKGLSLPVNAEEKYMAADGTYSYKAVNGDSISFGTVTVSGAAVEAKVSFEESVYFPVTFYDYEPDKLEPLNGATESVHKTMFMFNAIHSGRNDDTKKKTTTELSEIYGVHNVNQEISATKGLVNSELNSLGLPELSTLTTNQSLFTADKFYGNANFPFEYTADGYYVYDSNNNHVEYAGNGANMIKYNVSSRTKLNNGSIKGYDGFYPFNEITYDSERDLVSNVDNGVIEEGKKVFLFGMSMELNFVMPADGKIGDTDMIFSIFGDDDSWLFLCWEEDGVQKSELILDYGGIHGGGVGGTFNFADEFKVQTLTNPLVAGREYTMKLFYFERGEWYSRLSLKFNLPPEPSPETSPSPGPTPQLTPTSVPYIIVTPTPQPTAALTPTLSPVPETTVTPTPMEELDVDEDPIPEGDEPGEEPEEEPEEDPEDIPVEDPDVPEGEGLPQTGTVRYDMICGIGAAFIALGGLLFGKSKK